MKECPGGRAGLEKRVGKAGWNKIRSNRERFPDFPKDDVESGRSSLGRKSQTKEKFIDAIIGAIRSVSIIGKSIHCDFRGFSLRGNTVS